MRIADLTLAFLDAQPHELPLDGRADAEVRAWLGAQLAARELDAGKLDAPPPYDDAATTRSRSARAIRSTSWATRSARSSAWFANANAALGVRAAAARGEEAEGAAGALLAASFRHGLRWSRSARGRAMGSASVPATNSATSRISTPRCGRSRRFPALPLLPAMAHWHTYKFLAALAPAHKIVAAHDQGGYVRTFLDVAVAAALDALRS